MVFYNLSRKTLGIQERRSASEYLNDEAKLVQMFCAVFPLSTLCAVVFSPGRIVLDGEHVDYMEDGQTLSATTELGNLFGVGFSLDMMGLRIYSEYFGSEPIQFVSTKGKILQSEDKKHERTVAILNEYERAFGGIPSGDIALLASDLPVGCGLSTSASYGLGLLNALCVLDGRTMSRDEMVLFIQRAEHAIGVMSGQLDQGTMARAKQGVILRQTYCADQTYCNYYPWPEYLRLVVVFSGVSHDHSLSGYNSRVKEAREAENVAKQVLGDDKLLVSRSVGDLKKAFPFPNSLLSLRAKHIVTEADRVRRCCDLLSHYPDTCQYQMHFDEWLGQILEETHESLVKDYEVGQRNTNLIHDLIPRVSHEECFRNLGGRQFGGGQGGPVLALVDSYQDDPGEFSKLLLERYRDALRADPSLLEQMDGDPFAVVVNPYLPITVYNIS